MAKTKTIFYLPKYGQLGNQLAVLAHLLAFAIEYDFTIVHYASEPLLTTFKKSEIDNGRVRFSKWLANPVFSFGIMKLTKLISLNRNRRLGKGLFVNKEFNVDEEFNKAKPPAFIVITDWLFRYYSGVIKYQQTLRKSLSFDETKFTIAKHLLESAKNDFPLHTYVGVHVRKGDYATFIGGKYFYDNEVYYAKMKVIASQLDKCIFIICSNEHLCFDNEAGLNILYAKGSPAEDLFLLSTCRYIIGPPSTFSSWAAFAGDQYLLFLEDKNEDVSLSRFNKYYL